LGIARFKSLAGGIFRLVKRVLVNRRLIRFPKIPRHMKDIGIGVKIALSSQAFMFFFLKNI